MNRPMYSDPDDDEVVEFAPEDEIAPATKGDSDLQEFIDDRDRDLAHDAEEPKHNDRHYSED